MTPGPFTTITVKEWSAMQDRIRKLEAFVEAVGRMVILCDHKWDGWDEVNEMYRELTGRRWLK